MPRVLRSLPQTSHTVTRHVAKHITRDLLKQTDFLDDYKVILEEEFTGGAKQLRNLFNNACTGDSVQTQYQTYAFVSFKETFLEDHVGMSKWHNSYHPDIFTDTEHGIRIRPHHVTASVELTIRLRASNLSTLNSWTEALRLAHGSSAMCWKHDIDYDYPIPHDYISFVRDAYNIKESQYPDGEDLRTYLRRCFSKGIQKRSNASLTQHEIIMLEKQENIQGLVQDAFFYNTKEIESGIYEITIPYKYEYRKPIGLTMNTPASIRNKTIPKEYLKAWLPEVDRKKEPVFVPVRNGDFLTLPPNSPFYTGDGGTRLREWDDWFPNYHFEDYQTLTLVPIRVNLDKPRNLFNVKDLNDTLLPASVKTYLKDYADKKGYYRESLVAIEVFKVGEEEEMIPHDMDDNLNLTVFEDLDIRRRYYVRISFMKDLSLYNARETEKLLKEPQKAIGIFKLYDSTVFLTEDRDLALRELPVIDRPGKFTKQPSMLFNPNGKGITPHSFTLWLRKLPNTHKEFLKLPMRGPYSVTGFNIKARRR